MQHFGVNKVGAFKRSQDVIYLIPLLAEGAHMDQSANRIHTGIADRVCGLYNKDCKEA